MATYTRVKTWNANETLTAADLNAEFDNIITQTNSNNLDSNNLDPTDTYTFAELIVGGTITSADGGQLHVWTASAGTVQAHADADEGVFENSGNTGLTILSGTTGTGNLYFGDSGGNNQGRVVYDHNVPDMALFVEDTEIVTLTATAAAINKATTITGTLTVGVDDTGYDVILYGASAGAFAYWDETNDYLDLRGATAAGPGHLKLTTGETTNVDGGVLGRIDFQAPLDAGGTDAILVAASIWAEATATFSSSVNTTDIVFAAATSETAGEIMRMSKTALFPATDDALDLGVKSTFEWSNSYWASGAVFSWNNDDVTLTHSANTLTVAGGTLATAALTATSVTATGKIATTLTTEQLRLSYAAGDYATFTVGAAGELTIATVDADAALGHLSFSPDGDTRFTTGKVFINETANAFVTTGLSINQGGADNEALALMSTDTAQNATAVADANTWMDIVKHSAASGGALMTGFTDGTNGIEIQGLYAVSNTIKAANASCPVFARGVKIDGTGRGAAGADDNLFGVADNGGVRFLVDEDGDLYADGGTSSSTMVTQYDGEDDVQLCRALDITMSKAGGRGFIESEWDRFVTYDEDSLIELGLLGAKRIGVDSSHRGLFNYTGIVRMHNGAIGQLGQLLQSQQAKIEHLEQKLLEAA